MQQRGDRIEMDEDELLSTFNHLQDYNRYLSTVLDEGVVDLRAKDSAVYQIGLIVRVLPSRERELTVDTARNIPGTKLSARSLLRSDAFSRYQRTIDIVISSAQR